MATSPGQYKGVQINAGSQDQIMEQIAAIDATPKQQTPISASTLSAPSEAPLNVPAYTQPTGTSSFQGLLETMSKERSTSQKATQSSGKDFAEALFGAQGETALTDQLYSQTDGVDDREQELSDINQQILQEQEGLRRELETIQDNANAEYGVTKGAVAGRMDEARRKSLRTQADLAVVQMAKQGRYDSAKRIADRAIAVQLEKQKQTLDSLRFIYEENKSKFEKTDQRLFDTMLKDRERELNREEDNLKTISDLSLDALQNGAPPSLAAKMRAAKTPEEAMRIGGQYVGSLDRQLKIAQINKIGYDNMLAEAAMNDRKYGILTDADIKAIDNSPQGKQLNTASNLKLKLSSYQDLVKKYGFEIKGADKAVLENAYIELQLAYKEAANLGVLNGPDLTLVEAAIRSATPGFWGNVGNVLSLGGGTRSLVANLEQAQTTLNAAASQSAEQLYARNPSYQNSSYVQSLLLPFGDELITSSEIGAMDAALQN
jgi:hypothetical protein